MIETMRSQRLAQEELVTVGVEQERETFAAKLEEAKRIVITSVSDYDGETTALFQKERELGLKAASEKMADANQVIADLKRQTAEINAKITEISGGADAKVIEATQKAEASRYELLVAAYGGPDQYKRAICAESLPENFTISYLPVGPGTFWTDISKTGGLQDLAALQLLNKSQQGPARTPGNQ
jgi:hypothetical protein